MTSMHPVEELFYLLRDFGSYPPGVLPIPERIPGTAFFPGGAGLWGTVPGAALPPMPMGGVMLVGNNFDSEASYQLSLRNGMEHVNGGTWRPLRRLLSQAGIPVERCFFTNAYMGLKPGDQTTGLLPASRDESFRARCQMFFLQQLRVMQARVIVALGAYVPPFLAPLSDDLLSDDLRSVWSMDTTFAALDRNGVALVYPVTFATLAHPAAVATLVHPSYRHINIKLRQYKGLQGDHAEVALLQDAVQLVGGV